MFRIYAHQKNKGWVIVDAKKDKKEAIEVADKLNPKDYYSYVVVEANGNGEIVIKRGDFTSECKVELVDDLETDFEVKTMTFKPSKMKEKEELRKLTQNYTSSKDFGDDDRYNY